MTQRKVILPLYCGGYFGFCTVATVFGVCAFGQRLASDRFVKTDELKIAHITDTHYYPPQLWLQRGEREYRIR